MVPPPPGLFSTTAVWLRLACKPAAISRATTSLEPPGVNGTMRRSVWSENPTAEPAGCCARAASGQDIQDPEDAAAPPASSVMNSRRFIRLPHWQRRSIGGLERSHMRGPLHWVGIKAEQPADWQDWQSLQVRPMTRIRRAQVGATTRSAALTPARN